MICSEVFFPFVFSPLLIRLPYTFQNQSSKKTQRAPGRCHAKAGITHHPSAHIREGSSSLSQLFPLTGTHSEAQNGTSSAISKDKLLNDKPDCHFIGRRTHTAAALGTALGYGSSAPGVGTHQQILREHSRSILSRSKFLHSLWLVFLTRSDLEKK